MRLHNESKIRAYYDNVNMDMGAIVSLLQEHGLEEDVPGEKHLKKYAQLLNAEYIAIQDKKGKTITSYGKYNNDVEEKVIEGWDDIIDWYTSADSLVSAERDYTDYQTVLPNGNTLFYQIQNKEINEVETRPFPGVRS